MLVHEEKMHVLNESIFISRLCEITKKNFLFLLVDIFVSFR